VSNKDLKDLQDLVANQVVDHGLLTGLTDDDHTQYLTSERHGAISGNPHSTTHDLTSPATVDPASADATRNKHVSNKDIKDLLASDAKTVDTASTDATLDKHVSNNLAKGWQDHKNITAANPHGTTHAQTSPAAVDPASADTTRDKHVSNNDIKVLTANDAKTVDQTSTDATKDKHLSNALAKGWEDHKGVTAGNPHGTTHAQTSPSGVVLTDTNTTQDKHISNAQGKAWEDHRNAGTLHVYNGTTAPDSGVYKLWLNTATGELAKWNGSIWEIPGTYQ
jgi:hypothetical protein